MSKLEHQRLRLGEEMNRESLPPPPDQKEGEKTKTPRKTSEGRVFQDMVGLAKTMAASSPSQQTVPEALPSKQRALGPPPPQTTSQPSVEQTGPSANLPLAANPVPKEANPTPEAPAVKNWGSSLARSLGAAPPEVSASTAKKDRLIGTNLHHFKILDKIGEGGMGRVYKAHDLSLDRPVALKVIAQKESQDTEQRQRFVREARAQARLNHPNIVQIYYIGEANDQIFFAMELVEGQPLNAPLERGQKIPVAKALQMAIHVADALKLAHNRGFIHRDIKPSNLLIDGANRVKVADFGLAKALETGNEHDPQLTQKGDVLGSPLYISPEQAHGERVDHRSDIYSLGATLYHLITGEPAFDGKTPLAVISKHLSSPVPDLKKKLPKAPDRVEKIIKKMMAKKPEDRFQTYEELLDALRAASPDAFAPAGFVVRAMAFGVDWSLGLVIFGLLSLWDLIIWGWAIFLPYLVIGWWLKGKTLGKWLFKLSVRTEDNKPLSLGKSIFRCLLLNWGVFLMGVLMLINFFAFGDTSINPDDSMGGPEKTLSYILLLSFSIVLIGYLLGFIWAGIRAHKRTWHDLLAKTMVVYDVTSMGPK